MARRRIWWIVAVAAVGGSLWAAPAASADDGERVDVRGTCSAGSRSRLRVEAEDGRISVEFRVDARRRGGWTLVLLHERRLAYRGTLRGRSVELRRTVPDWFGSDTLTVRATSKAGETCRASATVRAR
jgi:hypothetical protein